MDAVILDKEPPLEIGTLLNRIESRSLGYISSSIKAWARPAGIRYIKYILYGVTNNNEHRGLTESEAASHASILSLSLSL